MTTGDVREAVAIGQEMVRIVAPLGDYFVVGTNTANAAQATAMAGDLTHARAMLDPIVRSLDTARDADVVGFMVPYSLLHLSEGDLAGAVRWFERGIQRMAAGTRDWTATRCLPGLVGALRRLGRTEETGVRGRPRTFGVVVTQLVTHQRGTRYGRCMPLPSRAPLAHSTLIAFSERRADSQLVV